MVQELKVKGLSMRPKSSGNPMFGVQARDGFDIRQQFAI